MTLQKLIEWIDYQLHKDDWRTWVGHGVWGLLSAAFCDVVPVLDGWASFYGLTFAFTLREARGILDNLAPARAGEKAAQRLLRDGVLDWLTPYVGHFAYFGLLLIV